MKGLEIAREVLADERAWLVGGAVRDRLLGRETDDVDLAVDGDPRPFARRIARAARGTAFQLSGAFGAWRVVGPEHAWHVDLVTLRDGGIEADLAHRDFTINAMAEPLGGGELLDPHGGRADLESRLVRMVSPRALAEDPLRALRAVRIAVELELELDAATGREAAARAGGRGGGGRAGARGRERGAGGGGGGGGGGGEGGGGGAGGVSGGPRGVAPAPAPRRGLELMAAHGLLDAVLPELAALRGIE